MSVKKELKERIYILTGPSHPLSYTIASKDTHRRSLLYFDEEKQVNRPLRYSVNQKSPFQDEQDDKAILEPIVFEDGQLTVQAYNTVLQKFLELHPDNTINGGNTFQELDHKEDAVRDIKEMDFELDAMLAAREMNIGMAESVARVLMGSRVDRLSNDEIRRDLLVYARNNPYGFLDMINDPDLKLRNVAIKAMTEQLFVTKNNGRDIYFNMPENKKKLMSIPLGDDPVDLICAYLQSDDGLDLYKLLSNKY